MGQLIPLSKPECLECGTTEGPFVKGRCGRHYKKQWKKDNRERVLATQRKSRRLNPERHREYTRTWVKRNPEAARISSKSARVKAKFGLTLEAYEEMVAQPCGLCGTQTSSRFPDHNHTTGQVRGPLCNACNVAVGHLEVRGQVWVDKAMEWIFNG